MRIQPILFLLSIITLCLSASVHRRGLDFNPFHLITSQKVVEQKEFRQNAYQLAMRSLRFRLCMDSTSHHLQPFTVIFNNLLDIRPGRYTEQLYTNRKVNFVEFGKKYKQCNSNIDSYHREIVDQTVSKYQLLFSHYNLHRKRLELVGKNIFQLL